jgi:hypothetical protein
MRAQCQARSSDIRCHPLREFSSESTRAARRCAAEHVKTRLPRGWRRRRSVYMSTGGHDRGLVYQSCPGGYTSDLPVGCAIWAQGLGRTYCIKLMFTYLGL